MQRKHVFPGRRADGQFLGQFHAMPAPAAPRTGFAPGLFHQDIAHGPSRREKEVPPAIQARVALAEKPGVGFVDQRRRLQGLAGGQARHPGLRQGVQLVVDERQQLVRRGVVPSLRGLEQGGHPAVRFIRHRKKLRRSWQSSR